MAALEQSFTYLIARHESLRTTFSTGWERLLGLIALASGCKDDDNPQPIRHAPTVRFADGFEARQGADTIELPLIVSDLDRGQITLTLTYSLPDAAMVTTETATIASGTETVIALPFEEEESAALLRWEAGE